MVSGVSLKVKAQCTDTQTDRQAGRLAGWQAGRPERQVRKDVPIFTMVPTITVWWQPESQSTDRQTGRRRGIDDPETDRHSGRQAGRQDSEAGEQRCANLHHGPPKTECGCPSGGRN